MAGIVYLLCSFTSLMVCLLLFRNFLRTRVRLLLWVGICFGGLAINNAILYLDFVVVPDMNLAAIRMTPAFLGVLILLSGLIWDSVN